MIRVSNRSLQFEQLNCCAVVIYLASVSLSLSALCDSFHFLFSPLFSPLAPSPPCLPFHPSVFLSPPSSYPPSLWLIVSSLLNLLFISPFPSSISRSFPPFFFCPLSHSLHLYAFLIKALARISSHLLASPLSMPPFLSLPSLQHTSLSLSLLFSLTPPPSEGPEWGRQIV